MPHFGYCNRCGKRAPASYKEAAGQVLLVKDCADCGRTETVVSTDRESWLARRRLDRLRDDSGCALNCLNCAATSHDPTTVFIDVTNRCNQDCPICIANLSSMGFKFDPPFEYFEKLFRQLAAMNPKPSVKLFGGEPTVRPDLVDIIKTSRKLGLSTSVVTNGLKLADEEYCRELLATRAKLIFSFDGREPRVYEELRGDARILDTKLKALENVRKHHKSKITIMCVIAKGLNDGAIGDLIEFCHERMDFINACEFIPLAQTWEKGTDGMNEASITAIEDAERVVAAAFPDGRLEFLPAGLQPFRTISRYLPLPRLTFAGAHPNCESVTFLVSDGHRYRPVSDYLIGKSLHRATEELVRTDERLGEILGKNDNGKGMVRGIKGLYGRATCLMSLARIFFRNADLKEILGERRLWKCAKISLGLLIRRKAKTVFRANSRLQNALRVVVLPFEEPRTLDSAKLRRCPAAFAFEDVETGDMRTMPVCAWGIYKDATLKQIMDKYAAPASDVKQ